MDTFQQTAAKKILDLKHRHDLLTFRRQQAVEVLKERKRRLAALKEAAKQEFGTDDPKALAKRLETLKQEITDHLEAYEAKMEACERALEQLENALKNLDEPPHG